MKKRYAQQTSVKMDGNDSLTTSFHSKKRKWGVKIITAVVALALAIAVIPVLAGCNRQENLVDTLSHYRMAIVFCETDRAIDVTMTLDYRNNYDVELPNLVLQLHANAFREGAKFSPVADHERTYAFPSGISYGGMTINSLAVNGNAATINIAGEDQNELIVPFERPLMPTNRITIEIEFRVTIPNVRHRLGWHNDLVNLGNFFPIAAVWRNGEFATSTYSYMGDPFFSSVANFEVCITKPATLTAAMSGATTRELLSGGRARTQASINKARDFAIVLGNFTVINKQVGDVDVRYYFHNDPESERSLQAAVDSIVTFSDLFGAYPYATFSTVQTAFLHGGMEYPALTMISDQLEGDYFREVIIHEAAHQWWYAVVGNCQVTESWIDEGLAELSTSLFFQLNPQYGITYESRMANALSTLSMYAQMFRQTPNFTTAMNRPLSSFSSSLEYVVIAYYKSKIMFDTVRAKIGDEAFFRALRNLYQDNKFGIINAELVIAAFENAVNMQLASFFNSWIDGSIQVFGSN
ncbi:MAG: M1 family metallopeptidase [Firmicutes bacterium]|nr:M1 family metallopeptidase [Bacillota bacterium]